MSNNLHTAANAQSTPVILGYGMRQSMANADALSRFDNLQDDETPYTMDELNARIDEAELEIERGEGKSFEEMMSVFKQQMTWLK